MLRPNEIRRLPTSSSSTSNSTSSSKSNTTKPRMPFDTYSSPQALSGIPSLDRIKSRVSLGTPSSPRSRGTPTTPSPAYLDPHTASSSPRLGTSNPLYSRRASTRSLGVMGTPPIDIWEVASEDGTQSASLGIEKEEQDDSAANSARLGRRTSSRSLMDRLRRTPKEDTKGTPSSMDNKRTSIDYVAKWNARRSRPGTPQENYSSPIPSPLGENYDIEYIEPQMHKESPKDILARVKDKSHSSGTRTSAVDINKENVEPESTVSIQSLQAPSWKNAVSRARKAERVPSFLFVGNSEPQQQTLSIMQPVEVISLAPTSAPTPAIAQQNLTIMQPSTVHTQVPMSTDHNLSLMAPKTLLNQAPTPAASPKLSLTIHPGVSTTPIPAPAPPEKGPRFTAAAISYILYICTIVPLATVAFNHAGEDIIRDLLSKMKQAFLRGALICLVLCLLQGRSQVMVCIKALCLAVGWIVSMTVWRVVAAVWRRYRA